MKKILFLAVAVSALAACAKMVPDSNQNSEANVEIKFQTAVYATKAKTKAGETVYEGGSFGVYAWSEASQLSGKIFMNDETVSNTSGVWMPSKTYYWPKTATVDFISYAPKAKAPAITSSSIEYTDYDLTVADNKVDLLYAEKAVGYGTNVDEVTTNVNSGVPTLFRHALAKVTINAALTYDRKMQQEADGTYTVTKWAVKVTGASFQDLGTTGSVSLALNSAATSGLIGWHTGASTSASQVWAPSVYSDVTFPAIGASGTLLKAGSANLTTLYGGVSSTDNYVIPQTLYTTGDAIQKLYFTYEIKTFRKIGFATEAEAKAYRDADFNFDTTADLFLYEQNCIANPNISTTGITSFEMAHSYTYNLMFTPTKGTGTGTSTPGTDVPTDNPNLDDVTIKFDPAVAGWTTVDTTATINI